MLFRGLKRFLDSLAAVKRGAPVQKFPPLDPSPAPPGLQFQELRSTGSSEPELQHTIPEVELIEHGIKTEQDEETEDSKGNTFFCNFYQHKN